MTQTSAPAPAAAAYVVLAHAAGQLQRGATDWQEFERALAALLHLGLGGLAERLLGAVKYPVPDWEAQCAALLEPVRCAPSGKVPWASRRRRFLANVAALAHHPIPDLAAHWETLQARYELYRAVDGNWFVVDTRAGHPLAGVLGGLLDHRAAAAAWKPGGNETENIMPVVFDGAGYGWLLQHVLETTNHIYLQYSSPVDVVETDATALCVLLHLHDLRPALATPRLRLYGGAQAAQAFEAVLVSDRTKTLPGWILANALIPRAPVPFLDIIARARSTREARQAAVKMRVDAYYAARTPADWARRFAEARSGGHPLKVMGFTTRYSTVLRYSMEEFGEAVRAAGHEFILSMESDDLSLERPDLDLLDAQRPDLLVMLSRMPHENPHLPPHVPAFCWDQDNLPYMRTEAAKKSLDAFTYVAGHGACHGFLNLGWPEQNCIFFKAAGSTHRYSNAPVAPELRARFACDFSYVSNASGAPESLLAQQVPAWKQYPAIGRLLEEVGAQVLVKCRQGYAWDGARLDAFVRDAASARGIVMPEPAHYELVCQLRRVSDRAFRHVALEWVAEYCQKHGRSLRLFGQGWNDHPRFGRYAEEFISPGQEMRALYQATRINLQIIETGFIHSRVLDGLAAGGFFLTRFAPEARDHNGTGRWVHAMAGRALATGLRTNGDLHDSGDPIIQRGWEVMARTMKAEELRLEQPCRYLRQWAAAPNEEVAFPQLDEITFKDKDSFAGLATHYLQDEPARRQKAEAMRRVVVDQFSYDACWRQALATIRRGLQAAAGAGV